MPPQLGVCPQCGWWDPDWRSPLRDTDKDVPEQKPYRVFTKKLEFKCTQCGANVAHDAEKCIVCGYFGPMQLRDKQNKSSVVANTSVAASAKNHSIYTEHNSRSISKTRATAIQSKGIRPKTKANTDFYKKSFNHREAKTTDNAMFWGYKTKRSFPLWLLLAVIISAVILIALATSLLLWFKVGN